jgi:hypothetical protein
LHDAGDIESLWLHGGSILAAGLAELGREIGGAGCFVNPRRYSVRV